MERGGLIRLMETESTYGPFPSSLRPISPPIGCTAPRLSDVGSVNETENRVKLDVPQSGTKYDRRPVQHIFSKNNKSCSDVLFCPFFVSVIECV